MNLRKIKIIFTLLFSLFFSFSNAVDKEYIYTDDVKINTIDDNLNHFELKINWLKLPIEARKQFEFYKISHSTTNPDVKYPDNFIWYTDIINNTIAKDNFSDYYPNKDGVNYYRVCIVANKYYCSKIPLIINTSQNNIIKDIAKTALKEKINSNNDNTTKTLIINSTQDGDSKTRSISYAGDNIKDASIEVTATDESVKYLTYFFITLILSFLIFFIIKKINFNNLSKNKEINNQTKENVLQILKSENEYIVEYNGIYNKGIKVLEQNKNNITSSIYNYVNSINKLQVRGKDLYEELNNLDIKIPDLKESGNTLYRLYLPENIRISLKNEDLKNPLIIKTDEQEIPWEIMHDNDNFLSLKFPISRKIMTRENIRKNEVTKNKIPKILFITNPTLDLEGAIKETKEIINKLGKKADITLINGKEATSTKIFSLLGQNFWDIIHYSGHAYFDKVNPDQSGLILNDGVITACEIKRLLNGKPLIFLNGCSSGRSDEKDFEKTGEDTTGIASSFLIGGASGVISTLWPVTDKASSSFAIEFYDNFLKKETIGNSILKAKKEIFINFPNDITWASFIYYGEPNLTIN